MKPKSGWHCFQRELPLQAKLPPRPNDRGLGGRISVEWVAEWRGIRNCELDGNEYPKGIKVTDAEMNDLKIDRHSFHGEWNYTILP
mgnify:CR=1 FL=1